MCKFYYKRFIREETSFSLSQEELAMRLNTEILGHVLKLILQRKKQDLKCNRKEVLQLPKITMTTKITRTPDKCIHQISLNRASAQNIASIFSCQNIWVLFLLLFKLNSLVKKILKSCLFSLYCDHSFDESGFVTSCWGSQSKSSSCHSRVWCQAEPAELEK